MIKFFRSIRQNLLNEGKTVKYFKYAIGEIVLVVIGILIALQINNWNQDRQQRQKEKKILMELKRDLVSNDSILLNEINLQLTVASEITTTIEHLKNKKPFNDTISSYLNRIAWIERIEFVSSAYESLKSIGIDIITSDNVRADIAYLFGNRFPFTTNWLRDAGLKHADLVLPFYVKYFEMTVESVQTETQLYSEENPTLESRRLITDYENLLKSQEFINAISKKRGFKNAIVGSLKELQNRVKKTISSIDNELQNSN